MEREEDREGERVDPSWGESIKERPEWQGRQEERTDVTAVEPIGMK